MPLLSFWHTYEYRLLLLFYYSWVEVIVWKPEAAVREILETFRHSYLWELLCSPVITIFFLIGCEKYWLWKKRKKSCFLLGRKQSCLWQVEESDTGHPVGKNGLLCWAGSTLLLWSVPATIHGSILLLPRLGAYGFATSHSSCLYNLFNNSGAVRTLTLSAPILYWL